MLLLAAAASPVTAGTTSYRYDDLGRLVTVTNTDSSKTRYVYDKTDNRAEMKTATVNSAPVCPSFTIPINDPSSNPVNFTVPLGQGCTDADGDALTVTVPGVPYTIVVNPHTTTPVTYAITDGYSITSATITVTRP